jgi:chaperonin GroES
VGNLKPLEDKIILQLEKEAEKKSAGGLIIQTMQEEKPQEAIVIAVGPGVTFPDGSKLVPDLKVGDKVVYSKYQGTEITVDGEDLLILAYRDIFAVLEGE